MSRRKTKPKTAPIAQAAADVIELPPEERGVPPEVVAKFDYERRRLLNPLSTPKAREDAARNIANLEANREKWGERAWQERVQAETKALAEERGEEVGVEGGRLRVYTRDSLGILFRHDKLTERQYETAIRYRAGRRVENPGIGSQMGAIGQVGAATVPGRHAAIAAARAKMETWTRKVETKVAIECSAEPVCLQMLRWVAGEGNLITSYGKGRAYERNLRALRRALDVAATVT